MNEHGSVHPEVISDDKECKHTEGGVQGALGVCHAVLT